MTQKLKLNQIIRALKYRNYKLFFGGQVISLTGTWMQQVAMGWMVYRLTASPFLLGLVGFASQIPAFIVSPLAGVYMDRWGRHKVIVIAQILFMVQALILTALVFTNLINIYLIIALELLLGFINGFDSTARQAFIVELVEKREDLVNAIALNSSSFNATRLIGPAVAGILISTAGEGVCFLLNGISYIAVIWALLSMKLKKPDLSSSAKKISAELKEGFSYSFGFPPIRVLLTLFGVMTLIGMPYAVLMPVFAKDILHGDARTLGILMGSVGIGALVGAYKLASRESALGLGKLMVKTSAAFGAAVIIFSLSTNLILSLAAMGAAGFSMMMTMASNNTILQTIVEEDKRSRLMSIYTMIFMGMAPLGSLIAGSIASKIGAPNTLIICGIISIASSYVFSRKLPAIRKLVHPIYSKLGIIPELATGVNTVTHLTEPPEQQ